MKLRWLDLCHFKAQTKFSQYVTQQHHDRCELTRTSMRIPLKTQPIQQGNLIRLQLTPPLKLPLPTGPPTQSPQFLDGLFAHSLYIGIGYGAFEITVPVTFVIGDKVAIVGVPGGWFEE